MTPLRPFDRLRVSGIEPLDSGLRRNDGYAKVSTKG